MKYKWRLKKRREPHSFYIIQYGTTMVVGKGGAPLGTDSVLQTWALFFRNEFC